MTEERRAARVLPRALVMLLSVLLAVGVIAPGAQADPDDATPDELQQRIDELFAMRHRAEIASLTATEDYNYAQEQADRARERSDELNAQLESSRAILAQSQGQLRQHAVSSYRSGQTSMPALEPLVSDGDFDSVLQSLQADAVISKKRARTTQRHDADLLYVSVVEERARVAQEEADEALIEAEEAYERAGQVLEDTNRQIDEALAERETLIRRLAERTERTVEEVTEEQDEREESLPVHLVSDPEPASPPEETEAPEEEPEPEADPDPEPSPEPTSSPSTSPSPSPSRSPSASPSPSPSPSPSASSSPSPSPSPTTAPPPPPPPPPPPTNSDRGQGTAVGSAAQGQAAVAWARQQEGKPYLYGGAGPNAFDCSGLTMRAWEAAGVNITRSSRTQYQRVLKIEKSQMRPGDLIFWATDTSNPNTIYHVAMYMGNNQIVEATTPGNPVRISTLTANRSVGTMQYAGRP